MHASDAPGYSACPFSQKSAMLFAALTDGMPCAADCCGAAAISKRVSKVVKSFNAILFFTVFPFLGNSLRRGKALR